MIAQFYHFVKIFSKYYYCFQEIIILFLPLISHLMS